jgi:transcriptional regulator with XRE-family HTH domain
MTYDESLGQRVRRLRLERGLTQRAVERGMVGVSYAHLARIELGDRYPSARVLREIAKALQTTALYLESGNDNGTCPHCGRVAA